jgi:hypothetical protein
MADVYVVTFTVQDAKGYQATFRLNTPRSEYGNVSGDSLQELTEYLEEVAIRLSEVVRGAIVSCKVSIPIDVSAIKPTAEPGSDVEEGALFAINRYTRFVVPAFNHELLPEAGSISPLSVYPVELYDFVWFLLQPEDDTEWPAEYGGISDNRGNRPVAFDEIRKTFKRSRG